MAAACGLFGVVKGWNEHKQVIYFQGISWLLFVFAGSFALPLRPPKANLSISDVLATLLVLQDKLWGLTNALAAQQSPACNALLSSFEGSSSRFWHPWLRLR